MNVDRKPGSAYMLFLFQLIKTQYLSRHNYNRALEEKNSYKAYRNATKYKDRIFPGSID
jgi:hypothetical protein